jgi:hypothetical protein
MPAAPKISTMPEVIRDQLDRRLVASGFGDLVAIAGWLSDQGYPIGKSALGAYSKANRAHIESRVAAAGAADAGAADRLAAFRLRVLELAAAEPGPDDLITRAERLLAWVQDGR